MALASAGLTWLLPRIAFLLRPADQALLVRDLAEHFGGHPQFSAFGVIENDRSFRVTLLNPTGLRTTLPGEYDEATRNARYGPSCLAAWDILHLAVGRLPSSGGDDPGYVDYRLWRWPVVVEFGPTQPGTLEARLNRFTFSPAEQRAPHPPAQCRR